MSTLVVLSYIVAIDAKVKWVQKVPVEFSYQANKVIWHRFENEHLPSAGGFSILQVNLKGLQATWELNAWTDRTEKGIQVI